MMKFLSLPTVPKGRSTSLATVVAPLIGKAPPGPSLAARRFHLLAVAAGSPKSSPWLPATSQKSTLSENFVLPVQPSGLAIQPCALSVVGSTASAKNSWLPPGRKVGPKEVLMVGA